MATSSGKRGWLNSKHPAYEEMLDEWVTNERRMLGGKLVLDELMRFDWELANGEHYTSRQQNAVYLNFPDRFASMIVGHMMREAPTPEGALNFGGLGKVRRRRDIDFPTEAELFYYNTDGVGGDGSQWDNYWTTVGKSAVATGIRWVLVEGSEEQPQVRGQEISDGLRPFLSDFSPLSVWNFLYERGRLSFATVKRSTRSIEINDKGEVEGNDGAEETLLLVRRGFTGFGVEYTNGGWWIYDSDLEEVSKGNYNLTGGEIPMVPLYYERLKPTTESQCFARSGITELGNASVSYMNLSSAADYDAIDGASSVQALIGADEDGFNLFIRKMKEGNRYAPLPPAKDSQKNPEIKDASTGVVVADVFDRRLTAKREEAIQLMLNELQAAPYASGESKKISFTDTKAPRLALFASEMETAQNAVIRFTEMLWGKKTTGSTEWPREFDLLDAATVAQGYFAVVGLGAPRSPTAEAKVMLGLVRESGIAGDTQERTKIQAELMTSATTAVAKEDAELKTLQNPPKPAGPAS